MWTDRVTARLDQAQTALQRQHERIDAAHERAEMRVTDSKLVYTRDELEGRKSIEVTTRRPTVTRVASAAILGGPIGALIGLAWRKKDRQRIQLP